MHPFIPESGQEFDYVGQTTKWNVRYIMCVDSTGKLREFPVGSTNMDITPVKSDGSGCVASVDDLLALESLLDAILLRDDVN